MNDILIIKQNNQVIIACNGARMIKSSNEFNGWNDDMIKSWACKQFNIKK